MPGRKRLAPGILGQRARRRGSLPRADAPPPLDDGEAGQEQGFGDPVPARSFGPQLPNLVVTRFGPEEFLRAWKTSTSELANVSIANGWSQHLGWLINLVPMFFEPVEWTWPSGC